MKERGAHEEVVARGAAGGSDGRRRGRGDAGRRLRQLGAGQRARAPAARPPPPTPSSAPAPASRRRSTSKWGSDYNGVTGVKLNYQSIGSGGGIAAIEAKTVDFGASDAPLEQAELERQRPRPVPDGRRRRRASSSTSTASPTGSSSSTPDVLAGIFMGKMTKWNDPAITALEPRRRACRRRKINVVHRSDGSGTTWIFTNYLTDCGRRRLDRRRRQGDRLAGRRRRQGQRGRRRQRAAAQRLASATSSTPTPSRPA